MADLFRIGVVIPFSGPGGQYGPSAQALSELAARDINATGGIDHRRVVLSWIDGGHSPSVVAAEVRRMLDEGWIDAITGWHTSAVRETVAPVVPGGVPYVYPALYEGGAAQRRVLYSGETPDLQIVPAVLWFRRNMRTERWAVVGDDYVWPRKSAAFLQASAEPLGVHIEFQCFLRPSDLRDSTALSRLCSLLRGGGVQAVAILMVGQNAARFNREFARHPDLARILRFCPLMDENTLLASGLRGTRDLFTAGGYFSSMDTAESLDLIGRFVEANGSTAPVLSTTAESCYEGLLALKAFVENGSSGGPVSYRGPRGRMVLGSSAVNQPIYLAVARGYGFEILERLL